MFFLAPARGYFIVMDVKQLREVIEDALVSIVGTYTLPNNTTLPAFMWTGSMECRRTGRFKDWKSSSKSFPRQTLVHASVRALSEKFWTVIMTDYQPASRSLLDAINALKKRFPDGEYRFRAENETVYGQCLVNIPDFDIFFLR